MNIYNIILKRIINYDLSYRQKLIALLQQKADGGIHYTNIFNRRYEFFKDNLGEKDTVLDIGCGTGTILKKISRTINKGIGVDISVDNISLCVKDNSEYHNLSFIHENIFNINYDSLVRDNGVTAIILSHILEHIEYPDEFICSLGVQKLLICVPSEENSWADFVKSLGLKYQTDNTHFREYTRDLLIQHLVKGGYEPQYLGFNQEGEIICVAHLMPSVLQ